MSFAKSLCFYLSLISVAVPLVFSSGVNKTTVDGKVFINGEIVVSAAQETKIALTELTKKLQSLEKRILFQDEIHGKLDAINKTAKICCDAISSLDQKLHRKLEVLNKSNEALSEQIQAMSQRLTQVGADYALLFPRKGISDYVMTRGGMPSLAAVTVCLWMKTTDTGNFGTVLSYAVHGSANELLLIDYRNFILTLRGGSSGRTSVSANDGKWHHICATWENTAGSWKLFKNGRIAASGKGYKTGHVIRAGGVLVLGQDQDSLGGSFDASDSFIGEMAGVNIWDHVIKDQEILRMSKSCLLGVGNVFQWRDFITHVKGSLKITRPSC